MPPLDPSLFIIPLTEPKPIVKLPSKPKVFLARILDPESDDDSNDDDIMNELYHFGELDLKNVEFEWFDQNKVVNSDGWNEMTETEAKPETKLKPQKKDWIDDADSIALEILY